MTDLTRLITSLKRRSAHAKDFGDDVTFVKLEDLDALIEALEKAQQHIARQEQILLNKDESLSIRRGELEAAQQERENWRTSFDNERFRADKLKAHIDDIEPIRAAAERLVRCKGRYHSEQNYRALAALFGVTTPDLPSLDSESRTVTVKLPPLNDDLISILGRPNFMCAHLAELLRKSGEDIKRKSEHEQAAIIHWLLGIYLEHGDKWEDIAKSEIQARVAGIKWEAE